VAAFQKQTKKSFLIASALATACIAFVLSLTLNSRAIQFLELGTYDSRVKLLDSRFAKHEDEREDEYVVIDIDNASFDQLKDKVGRWPWPRQVWAEVVRYVGKGKPKVIGIDIIFSGTESPEGDGEFAKVISRAGVVVPSYIFTPVAHIDLQSEESRSAEAAKIAVVAREGRSANYGEKIDRSAAVFNVPVPEIANAARGLGLINSKPDEDGAIRRVPLQYEMDSKVYPTLALRMAQVALDKEEMPARSGRHVSFAGHTLPVDNNGRMLVLWRNGEMRWAEGKDWGKNKRIPLWEVICAIYPAQCSAYKPRFDQTFFKDKIVLLGASAAGVYDFHPMPLGEQSPGFLAHMNAVENLLSGEAVTPTPLWTQILLVIVMTIAGAAVLVSTQSTWQGLVGWLSVAAIYIGFAIMSFMSSAHQWFPIAAPMLGFFGAFLSTGLIRYQTTGRELRRTRGTLNRYVSPQLVDYVLENLDRINLAGDKRELSILFSDVRNFTTMTESADPMELIKTLNEYLSEMTDVIFKYDGITDKFIGDGILAYWGAFTPGKNHAELASRAALEMLERLKVLNEGWKAEGRKELAIGIGINTGEVVFGNVGSGKKIEFTVIGDPVNLAARLESQTKEYGVQLIVSEFTAAKLNGDFQLRPLGGVKVKGKTVETKIFELQSVAGKAAASNQ
jgi:adenylate cyclase